MHAYTYRYIHTQMQTHTQRYNIYKHTDTTHTYRYNTRTYRYNNTHRYNIHTERYNTHTQNCCKKELRGYKTQNSVKNRVSDITLVMDTSPWKEKSRKGSSLRGR